MYKLSTKSSIFDMLFVFPRSDLESLVRKRGHRHRHANASSVCADEFFHLPAPFKCSPSQSGLACRSSSPYFPLQMAASTWEMSGSLCQRCLASSNICEVLSSSRQLRRAVSQESRLLTRNTAKAARPSALKHVHSGRSFASTEDCISLKFVVFTAALSPYCKGPCIA